MTGCFLSIYLKKIETKRQSSQIKTNNKASTIDTSDTVSLKNHSPTSLSNAEQKRRCNIQNGFDQLQTLVPSLKDNQNGKISKAAMLQKTAEYIKELQVIRTHKNRDLDQYKHEIDMLSNQISRLQCELPEDGVYISGNFNRTERFKQKFNSYCQQRISENWKFYPFSLILKPLFDNFVSTVNTSSLETLESSTNEWRNRYCNLSQLRPSKLTHLIYLSFK
jgi:MAX-like protein X